MAHFFRPISFTGSAYLGLLQTDSFFYTTVSNAVNHKSLLSLISDNSLIGYGMRSIDLVLGAVVAGIIKLNINEVWNNDLRYIHVFTPDSRLLCSGGVVEESQNCDYLC